MRYMLLMQADESMMVVPRRVTSAGGLGQTMTTPPSITTAWPVM